MLCAKAGPICAGKHLEPWAWAQPLPPRVKLAIDFESAMADVKKVVEFDEPQGFQKLGETISKK